MTRPTIDSVWGSTGSAIDPGDTKVNTGWVSEIPPFETQNFWQNRTDLLLQDIEDNGIMTWDALTTYSLGSWVMATDREIYKSIATPNTGSDPVSSPLAWTSFSSLVTTSAATESQAGIIELSTLAETQAGADDTRAVSPKNLKDSIQQLVPDASTTLKGKVELASNSETQTGTDTFRAVTPASLASLTASTSRDGLVERATDSEATNGTDTSRYINAKQLKAGLNSVTVPNASTSVRGIVELANTSETASGSSTTIAVTPKGLADSFTKDVNGNNGFVVLPGGVTLQWGTKTSTSDDNQSFSFAKTFPNASLVVMTNRNGSGAADVLPVISHNKTTFTINRPNGIDGSQVFEFFAVGF